MKLHKTSIIRILGIAFTALFLISCECSRQAKGLVLDETTQEPLDSVLVKGVENVHYEIYSDSVGSYFINTGMMGAMGGCPDMKVSFSKEGYHSQTLVNPDGNVYLKKK